MKISDLLDEGVGDAIKTGMGVAGASMGQAMKSAALGALGLKNTQQQYQQKHAIGSYDWNNAGKLMQQLGIKQGMDYEIGPGQKVKIVKTDNLGATYIDPKTKLPLRLDKDALQSIGQRQQALQTVASIGQQSATATQPPTMH
jgi:hypothetical protein